MTSRMTNRIAKTVRAYGPAMFVVLAACGQSAPTRVPPPSPPSAHYDPELLRSLAILATRHEPTAAELQETRTAIASGRLTIDHYIDSLVARPEFAQQVAPLVVLRHLLSEDALAAPSGFVLQRTEGADPIYFLNTACKPVDAVHVRPWWDLDHEVKICRESYRPAQWMAERPSGEAGMDCLSALTPFQPDGGHACGCGPSLMRCFESGAQRQHVSDSLRDELRGTVAWVAAHDLPAEQIFTSNESWRDRNAELVRLVNTLEARRTTDPEPALRALATWPVAGRWAAREDLAAGQNAGVLTSPLLLYNLPDRRQRMSILYDPLWCMQPDSQGATPESVISIKSGNLQLDSAGWQELAGRPLCTNCHARLDYGMQFFWGYPNGNHQAFFVPETQQQGRGALYVRDIDDPRGEADLNPQGFAQLAVAQPEFRSCMARDFAAYVLGNTVSSEQLEAIGAVARPNATSVRGLMKASLLALVRDWSSRSREPVAPAPVVSSTPTVAISPALNKELDHCLDCHDKDPTRVDLSAATLARETVVQMLADVAYGRMPKDRPLPPAERRRFLELFIAATWSGSDATTARSYYIDRMAALPAFRPEVMFDVVAGRAKGRGTLPWRMLESSVRSDLQQVTPGLIATSAAAAIEACRAAGRTATHVELEHCLAETMGVETLAIDPRSSEK